MMDTASRFCIRCEQEIPAGTAYCGCPPPDWSFWRWLRESRKFMGHKSAWWVYPRAALKWPAFDRKQREDRRQRAIRYRRDFPRGESETIQGGRRPPKGRA